MALRKGQRELVEQYRSGFCAVPAIPGGGKTHSLSVWAVEMIANGLVKPGKILIVTYMNSAVNNFKQRINRELLQKSILGKKEFLVSTIHSLCMKIIKEKPDLALASEEFQIISDLGKIQIISNALDEWKKHNMEKFSAFLNLENASSAKISDMHNKWHEKLLRLITAAISDFKTRGIHPTDAVRLGSELSDTSFYKIISQIYEIYEKRLKQGGYFDFDDILYQAKRILTDDQLLLKKYRETYRFVCEDEAQDSNAIQNDILELIADGNFLRVGDSNQAICGSFSNSDFRLFKNFSEKNDVTTYSITQSSRNTKEIINLANYFVKWVIENHPVEECKSSLLPQYIEPVESDDLFPNPATDGYGIRADMFDNWKMEVEEIAKRVKFMTQKYPEKTMAILVPASWGIEEIAKKFDALKIPYELLDNTSKERNKVLRQLGRMLDFISFPSSSEKFVAMLGECIFDTAGEDDLESEKENLLAFLKKYPVENILYPRAGEIEKKEIPEDIRNNSFWKTLMEKSEMLTMFLEFPSSSVEKLILWIGEKLQFNRLDRAIAQRVAEDVQYMMQENENFQIADLALELLSPKSRFNYFAGLVWELKGYDPKPGVPAICTYHKSKGMEWQTVFLTSLTNSEFPVFLSDKFSGEFYFLKEEYKNPLALFKSDFKSVTYGNGENDPVNKIKLDTISERTRLLYVGITRAKEFLILSGSYSNKGKKHESKPSQYLTIFKNFIEGEREKWGR